jgi:hypothetical protein
LFGTRCCNWECSVYFSCKCYKNVNKVFLCLLHADGWLFVVLCIIIDCSFYRLVLFVLDHWRVNKISNNWFLTRLLNGGRWCVFEDNLQWKLMFRKSFLIIGFISICLFKGTRPWKILFFLDIWTKSRVFITWINVDFQCIQSAAQHFLSSLYWCKKYFLLIAYLNTTVTKPSLHMA